MTSTSIKSPGICRGYTSEQKTLRAKLDLIIKWSRDLKGTIMKQSCKALQPSNPNTRESIDQIHDSLDDYKRKLDREVGLIHDICDALIINNNVVAGDEENLDDEILEALRRSPTYASLEQHIFDDKRSRIRVKPRERIHPGQNQIPRAPFLSTNAIKRKASQPIKLNVIDTTRLPGAKRRPPVDAFKRSRSFTNVEHTETQLGMDYVEEDENDLAWKPFGPKKSLSQTSLPTMSIEKSNDNEEFSTQSSITIAQSLPSTSIEKPKTPPAPIATNDSSDEEFDVAWERRVRQKARKEAVATSTAVVNTTGDPSQAESPPKRTVRFTLSTSEGVELIGLDLNESTEDGFQAEVDHDSFKRQSNEPVSTILSVGDEETMMSAVERTENNMQQIPNQRQITTTSTISSSSQQQTVEGDNSEIIEDSDDEIIALSDDDTPSTSNKPRKPVTWTSSEIQITTGNSQPKSLHNPYRIGIADPSIRSMFLPPPNSQSTSVENIRRSQKTTRIVSPTKRPTTIK